MSLRKKQYLIIAVIGVGLLLAIIQHGQFLGGRWGIPDCGRPCDGRAFASLPQVRHLAGKISWGILLKLRREDRLEERKRLI